MTSFAMAAPQKPLGELEDIAEHMRGSCWGDVALEAASGSDRGLIQSAATVLESALRDLLLSDQGPTDPDMAALIRSGGALCVRTDLVNYLDQHGFMSDREAAAVRGLFKCADTYFGWADAGVLGAEQWAVLKPYLAFMQNPAGAESGEGGRTVFYWAFWELTNSILQRISDRESGLA